MNPNNIDDAGKNTLVSMKTLKDVMAILDISDDKKDNFIEKYDSIEQSKLIQAILDSEKQYKENKKLVFYVLENKPELFKNFPAFFGDKDVALFAVGYHAENFYLLSKKLQNNKEIGKKMITILSNRGEEYSVVMDFIKKYFGTTESIKREGEEYYKNIIKKSQQVYIKDIHSCTIVLEKDYPDFFKKLISEKIISKKKTLYHFSEDFYSELSRIISDKNNQKQLTEKEIKNIILRQLQIPADIQQKYIDFLLTSIYKNIHIQKQKSAGADEKNKKEKKTETPGEDITHSYTSHDETLINGETYTDLDVLYPECNYFYSGGYYHIETTSTSIEISESEIQDFSSLALKNFIQFYSLLKETGLTFLWDRYSSGFTTLCNNNIGFDYKNGEGITKSKSLSILNLIGKNIGVPEKDISYTDSNGNKKKSVGCFKTIAEAKLVFGEISGTGKINNELIMEPGSFSSRSIIETYMIQNQYIDSKSQSINISRFG